MPLQNARLQPVDLFAEQAELIDEAVQCPSRQLRKTILRLVQSLDGGLRPAWPFGRDDPELREVTAQGVDQHRPLPDQEVPSLVEHQGCLLIDALDRHEAHRRPGHRLADGLGISGVGLSALHVGLDVGGRHQLHRMAQRRNFPRPVMRRATRFHPHQARLGRTSAPRPVATADGPKPSRRHQCHEPGKHSSPDPDRLSSRPSLAPMRWCLRRPTLFTGIWGKGPSTTSPQ